MLLRRPTELVCKILSPSNISVIHIRLLPASDVDSYRCRTLRLYLDAPSSSESHWIVPRAHCRLHGSFATNSVLIADVGLLFATDTCIVNKE